MTINHKTFADDHTPVKIGYDDHVFHHNNENQIVTIKLKKRNLYRLLNSFWMLQLFRSVQAETAANDGKIPKDFESMFKRANPKNCKKQADRMLRFWKKTAESLVKHDESYWKTDAAYGEFMAYMRKFAYPQ